MKKIKDFIKRILFEGMYLAYKTRIFKNKIRVCSIDETIESLIDSDKSLVRFGDAEISIIEGRTTKFQQFDNTLSDRLSEILQYKNDRIIVGIPDIFDSLDGYTKQSQRFWKEHLFFSRKTYEKYNNSDKLYANAFFSRLYYIYEDKEQSGKWFEKVKAIWKDKAIVMVEGEATHTGVGNDLLDNAKSVERILCPSLNAFLAYDRIKHACMKVDKEKLVLLAVGNSAKLLVTDLVEAGYRAIDIGNLDMEYEWYLSKAERKAAIPKHSIIGEEQNLKAGYQEYWSQVREIVKP